MCGAVGGGIMMGLQGLSGIMNARGQAAQGRAEAEAYKAQAAVNEQNAKLADVAAENARQQGMVEEERSDKQFDQLKGSQKATMAANGLDISSDTMSNLLQDTSHQKAVDATWIRREAQMKKWGFQSEKVQHLRDADQNKAAAKNAKKAGKMNAFSTLLSTAASVGMSYSNLRGTGSSATKAVDQKVADNVNKFNQMPKTW